MTDVTKHTIKKGKFYVDYAEDLLARFPGIDRAEILKQVVASALVDVKFGNIHKERAACDFLNLVQAEAVKQLKS